MTTMTALLQPYQALVAIGYIVSGATGGGEQGTSASPTLNLDELQMRIRTVTAPMTTLIQMSLITEVGTRLMFKDNQLVIQPPGIEQKWQRTSFAHKIGLAPAPPNHNDCLKFEGIINKAALWYRPDQNKDVAIIFFHAVQGLRVLRKTYQKTTTKDTITRCIKILRNACQEKASSGSKGKAAASSSSATDNSEAISSFAENVKKLWNEHDIKDVALKLQKISKLKEEPKDSVLAEKLQKVVVCLLDFKVTEFQISLNDTFMLM